MSNVDLRKAYSSDEMIDWSTAKDTEEVIVVPDPTGWRILVQPLEVKTKTAGGVILADETMEAAALTMMVGRVLVVGPLAFKDEKMGEPWAKVGDLVGFGKFAGTKFLYKGIPLILMNDEDVLLVYPE